MSEEIYAPEPGEQDALARQRTLRALLAQWEQEGRFAGWVYNQIHTFSVIVAQVLQNGQLHQKYTGDTVYYCTIVDSHVEACVASVVAHSQNYCLVVQHPATMEDVVFDPFTGISEEGPQAGFIVPDSSYLS